MKHKLSPDSFIVGEDAKQRSCFRCGADYWTREGDRICPNCRTPKPTEKPIHRELTFREKQIVALVTKAKFNKEIAYELHLAEGTVKEYLNRIFRKLGMTNRTELAIWAIAKEQEFKNAEQLRRDLRAS